MENSEAVEFGCSICFCFDFQNHTGATKMSDFDLFEDLLIGNENTKDQNELPTALAVPNGVLGDGKLNENVGK